MLVDIYDGDHESMTYHGKTLISKVTLREVCQVISRFGVYAPLLVNRCYGRQYEFVLLGLATRRECDSHALRAVCICCRVCSDHLTGRMKRTANVPFLPIHSCLVFPSSTANDLSAPPRQLAAQHRIHGVRFDPGR